MSPVRACPWGARAAFNPPQEVSPLFDRAVLPDCHRESAAMVDKHARHVWISSHLLHSDNVHENCNLGARQRLWDRDQPPGRKVPGLPLRTRLLVYLERDEGLSLLDAPGALGQCPGTGHPTGGEPSAHAGCPGVFALGARELRASLATTGVDRTLSGHALAVATRIAASPAHRPNRHREVVETDLTRLFHLRV